MNKDKELTPFDNYPINVSENTEINCESELNKSGEEINNELINKSKEEIGKINGRVKEEEEKEEVELNLFTYKFKKIFLTQVSILFLINY